MFFMRTGGRGGGANIVLETHFPNQPGVGLSTTFQISDKQIPEELLS